MHLKRTAPKLNLNSFSRYSSLVSYSLAKHCQVFVALTLKQHNSVSSVKIDLLCVGLCKLILLLHATKQQLLFMVAPSTIMRHDSAVAEMDRLFPPIGRDYWFS